MPWSDTEAQNADTNGGALMDYSESEDEEGVDALGTVVFADEAEAGFYGEELPLTRTIPRNMIC